MIGLLTSDLHYGFDNRNKEIIKRFLQRINKEKWDFMIIAGDIMSDKPQQFREFFELLRTYTTRDVFVVYGNHDYWDRFVTGELPEIEEWYEKTQKEKKEICDEFEIHYLQDSPCHYNEVSIYGFDGWYGNEFPPTNDVDHIKVKGIHRLHKFMMDQAHKSMIKILGRPTPNNKVILVTHFPTFPSKNCFFNNQEDFSGSYAYHNFITSFADIYCVGHSHRRENFVDRGCLVLNSGSDYNNPNYKLFNV